MVFILLTRKTKLERLSVTDQINGQYMLWLYLPEKIVEGKQKYWEGETGSEHKHQKKQDRKIEMYTLYHVYKLHI